MFPKDPDKIKEPHLVEQEDSVSETAAATLDSQSAQSNPDATFQTDPEDPYIGKTIGGHFQILSRIGTGGMSVVYLGKHLLLDKIVAIKVISARRVMDGRALPRFQQEAKAASALNHRNIAVVSEFGQDEDGSPFLVMEYVKGKPLSEVLKEEGKLTLERSIAIMLQLCDALHHAHEQSVVHRDIKPANVIVTTDSAGRETVKIVDFGIAKLLVQDGTNLTQSGEVFGTPNYMSPEQCLGKPADIRCDLYSLGCVFDEMLAGTPPFRSESALETLMMHVNRAPAGRHSPEINDVILRALEKEPIDRFQSAEEMAAALHGLDQKNLSIFQSSVPSKRRQKTAILFCGILSFALVAAAIFFMFIAKTETQRLLIGVALILYFGGLINIVAAYQIKKQPGQSSLKDIYERMTSERIQKKKSK